MLPACSSWNTARERTRGVPFCYYGSMTIYFVTSNEDKLREVQTIIPEVRQLDIDLPEIQHIDARKIIEVKLQEALKLHGGPLIVEDTSLYLDALNGLPGPLIKWFLKTMGTEGIYNIGQSMGNTTASGRTIIGYADGAGNTEFFEGAIGGEVVSPRGDDGFGWDEIFQPHGSDQTFAEMGGEKKGKISMRRLAVEQLQRSLQV